LITAVSVFVATGFISYGIVTRSLGRTNTRQNEAFRILQLGLFFFLDTSKRNSNGIGTKPTLEITKTTIIKTTIITTHNKSAAIKTIKISTTATTTTTTKHITKCNHFVYRWRIELNFFRDFLVNHR